MPTAKNSRFHPAWILAAALGIATILLLAVSLLLWRANRSFSTAWQQAQKTKASDAARAAASGASTAETRLLFPWHPGAKSAAALSLAADPPRLVELQFEIPPGVPAGALWTVSIAGPGGEAVRQTHLPANPVGSVSGVRIYVNTESLPPGSYRVALSQEEAANAGKREQWSFTVKR